MDMPRDTKSSGVRLFIPSTNIITSDMVSDKRQICIDHKAWGATCISTVTRRFTMSTILLFVKTQTYFQWLHSSLFQRLRWSESKLWNLLPESSLIRPLVEVKIWLPISFCLSHLSHQQQSSALLHFSEILLLLWLGLFCLLGRAHHQKWRCTSFVHQACHHLQQWSIVLWSLWILLECFLFGQGGQDQGWHSSLTHLQVKLMKSS